MAERLRILIDDTLETIKQTFDDRNVSRAQVAYWYIIVANQLKAQHLQKRDSGAFLSTFADVPVVQVAANKNPDFVKARRFLMLPVDIFDFDKDNGIEYITYTSPGGIECPPKFSEIKFQRTTPSEAEWLNMHPHTKPSSKNPYWYRVGRNIYLLGVEKINLKSVEMGIYMTISPVEKIDIDAPFPFPAELLHVLKRQVLDLARMSFFFPSERQNSGDDASDDNAGKQPIQKVQSVNASQNPNQE
jgi:hypothetical protein